MNPKKVSNQTGLEVIFATRRISLLLSLLALPVLFLFPIGHATTEASTCTGTTGDAFTPTGFPTNVVTHTIGNFVITTENFGLCFTGAFNGVTTGTVTIILNTLTGNGISIGQNTFTGTVTTSSGTASGTILAPFSSVISNGQFNGQFSLYGGTGGLADLHGHGTIQGSLATFVGTYTATLFSE